MTRTAMGLMLAILLLAASPTLATQARQPVSEARLAGVSGGGPLTVGSASSLRAPNPDETVVTGKVVMITPSEVVVATDTGLQRFAVTSDTDLSPTVVEGATVTLYYKSAPGTAQASVVQSASTATTPSEPIPAEAQSSGTASSEPSAGVASAAQETNSAQETRPVEATATDANSTAEQSTAPSTLKRLPKTASELPLIGLVGLLALAGAAVLRFAFRA
ncbi:MAG: hypothetical protein ACHQQS_10300 [Thermoanaerobaculales bacterium]